MPDTFDAFRARPDRSAVLTDFDGTLAPIVEDWTAAAPLPGGREVLERLAARYAVVAVISGRPVGYLAGHLGPSPHRVDLYGLYGLERMVGGALVLDAGAEAWRGAVRAAVDAAADRFGVLVEDKGLSMTVHFRTRPDLAAAVQAWAATEHERSGLAVRAAKASVELHPPVALDKGTVVEAAVAGLEHVCFLGDDVGDLPAFAALDRLRKRGVHTVKVGVRTGEAPSVLLATSDVVVDGPSGALELLRAL